MKEEKIPSGTNFNTLLKEDMLWLFTNKCFAHNRRYTEHPQCFLKEYADRIGTRESVGFLDIEATNLHADFGYILCYSLKPLDGEIIRKSVTPQDIRSYVFDLNVMKQFLKDIEPFTRLVGFYSKDYRFDIPFLRTRALKHELEFPEWRDYLFTDVYDLSKPKLRLSHNRLQNVCDLFQIPSKQHRMNPDVWQKAMAGSKHALDYIQLHCDEDVISLEGVYKKLHMFSRVSKTSM